MNKNIIISIGLLLSGFSYSQVGINTTNPQGIFNIDGGKDNPSTGSGHTAAEQLNDFTVTAAGNVGIGKIAPSTKLHITTGGTAATPNATGFRLEDGNQGKNKVLTSDASGIGTWSALFSGSPIVGVFSWVHYTDIGNNKWNSIASLTVPPGTFQIYTKLHVLDPAVDLYSRTYVGTKNLGTNNSNAGGETPILGSTGFQPLQGRDFELTQSFIYTNTSNANITLYFNFQSDLTTVQRSIYTWHTPTLYAGVNLIENYFFAAPLN